MSSARRFPAAEAAWQPFFSWVRAAGRDLDLIDDLQARAIPSRQWWDVLSNPSMIPDWRPGTAAYHGWWKGDWPQVGMFLHGFESL